MTNESVFRATQHFERVACRECGHAFAFNDIVASRTDGFRHVHHQRSVEEISRLVRETTRLPADCYRPLTLERTDLLPKAA